MTTSEFKVGEPVRYVGPDMHDLPKGAIGKVTSLPFMDDDNDECVDVLFPGREGAWEIYVEQLHPVTVAEVQVLPLPPPLKPGDRVEFVLPGAMVPIGARGTVVESGMVASVVFDPPVRKPASGDPWRCELRSLQLLPPCREELRVGDQVVFLEDTSDLPRGSIGRVVQPGNLTYVQYDATVKRSPRPDGAWGSSRTNLALVKRAEVPAMPLLGDAARCRFRDTECSGFFEPDVDLVVVATKKDGEPVGHWEDPYKPTNFDFVLRSTKTNLQQGFRLSAIAEGAIVLLPRGYDVEIFGPTAGPYPETGPICTECYGEPECTTVCPARLRREGKVEAAPF